jgi:TonB family protein
VADGTLTDVAISKSSGSKRLDDTAAAHIKAHYRWETLAESCNPATINTTIIVNWLLDPPTDVIALTMAEADYPPGSVERGEQGRVILTFRVDFGGVVTDVLRVTGSSGYPELDARTVAILKNRIGEKLFRPWPALPIPSRTEPAFIVWKIPAPAIASLRRKGIEIVEVHAPSIVLRAFDGPTPVTRP